MKKLLLIGFIFAFLSFFLPASAKSVEVHFFYSQSCPHCAAEQEFLDEIKEEYPEVSVYRYSATDVANYELMARMLEEKGEERYLGIVPLTFAGKNLFIGFDEGVENGIRETIKSQLEETEVPEKKDKINLPVIGEVDIADYSLPSLAVILGFLDGFNICSLGALVLILGMVLILRSRKKIMLFGGLFILTTAVVYGLLIVLWYKIFSLFLHFLRTMEIVIGLLGVGGAVYFLRQFFKFRKYGPACETGKEDGIIGRFSLRLQEALKKPGNALPLVGSIFLFALLVTVVEFPCSAVVPVAFAGVLAKAQLSLASYLFYIAIFVLFYMLDELVVFLLAVFKMTIWMASGKFVTWVYLVEGLFLLLLGLYYLF